MNKLAFLLLLNSSAFAEATGNTLMLGYQASVKSDNGVQLDGNERFQEIFFEGFGASESMDINAWCIP